MSNSTDKSINIKTVYVIGHKNPDTDSIASAIGYAALKNYQGQPNVVAAMAGEPNPQTRYILERLEISAPIYLADVRPKVRHIIQNKPVTASADLPLKDALQLFHRHSIRVLPVVNAENKPIGMVSLLKLSEKYLVAGTDRKRGIDSSISSLLSCLEGSLLTGQIATQVEHLHLFIGAMIEESFSQRIVGYEPSSLLVMTGDRPSIQKAAVDKKVRVLIVTGGFSVDDSLKYQAEEQGVTIISTPFDTATSAWLARLSTPVSCFVEPHFEQVGIGESLENLRLKLIHSGEPAVVAVEEDGTIAGVATKSSLLSPIPFALILVDHNELAQAVSGAEAVEVLEIIDHHKLGNPPTNQPITFMAAPVGSTCTVVASIYRERNILPKSKIAALLLAGILTDTVILKSPTTTDRDREIVKWLEPVAGLEYETFGKEIFSSCSGFSAYKDTEKAVRADFKHFSANNTRFGVGQVEVMGFDEFYGLKDELHHVLQTIRKADNLDMVGLMVTDIYRETTLFLMEGKNEVAHVMEYPQLEPHLYELKGVMSRKKQMLPHLLKVLGAL